MPQVESRCLRTAGDDEASETYFASYLFKLTDTLTCGDQTEALRAKIQPRDNVQLAAITEQKVTSANTWRFFVISKLIVLTYRYSICHQNTWSPDSRHKQHLVIALQTSKLSSK
eukprot:scaffold139536_cov30-Prasinocladus_malaysianus.AAC.1